MALSDLTPGLLLDGASGSIVVAFGALALLVRSRHPSATGFGVFAIAWGLRAVVANLSPELIPISQDASIAFSFACYWIAGGALAWTGWRLFEPSVRTPGVVALAIVAGILPPVVHIMARRFAGSEGLGLVTTTQTVTGAFLALLVLLAYATARETNAAARRDRLVLGVALIPWTGLQLGISQGFAAADPRVPVLVALAYLLAPALVALVWARASATLGRGAFLVAFLLPGATVVGQVLQAVLVDADDSGVLGATRTLSCALMAYALSRAGVLRGGFVIRRGTFATGLLAVVLIVAQLAQNVLETQYGLLTGSVVAGAFLFAAHPIQRAIERASERSVPVRPALPAAAPRRDSEELYLNAVRLALRDKRLTRDEESHLHHLAEGLGLSASRAHDLLVQAERERDAESIERGTHGEVG